MAAQAIEVTAADGHRFGLNLYAAASERAPVLLFFPAMGAPARFYGGLGEALAATGTSFAACDWRGIGSSTLRASRTVDYGYRHLVEADIPAAVAALRTRLPQAPMWMGGHSLGAHLTPLYASRWPEAIEGLVIIAAGTVHYRAWTGRGALRILALTQSAPLISVLLGHYPGRRIGFAGREARGVIGDWARVARTGRFEPRGSGYDYEAAMTRLQKPVLTLGFHADDLAPATATDALLAKMPRCRHTRWYWGAADTAGHALDHFSWARQPGLVAPALAGWLLENTRQR